MGSRSPEARAHPGESCLRTPSVEAFDLPGWHGVFDAAHRPADLGRAVGRLTDPASAVRTLHWGRNYLYEARLETEAGPLPAVVKQFRNESLKARLRRRLRGSKAQRSWAAAEALLAAGIETPEPVLVIESDDPAGPSFYVTRLAEGVTEARYLLRAANAGEAEGRFPDLPMEEFLDALADLARSLHRHRIWFRDLTSGNVLLDRRPDGSLRLRLVDLNRARLGRRLTLSERTRDLSRMPIFRPQHQDRLLRAYWSAAADGRAPSGPAWWAKRLLYLLYHHAFRAKNRAKQRIRAAKGRLAGKVVSRGTHVHIPDAPEDAPSRERVVWDHLSDQPHLHATPLQKLGTRLYDARSHLAQLGAAVRSGPRVARRYRRLRRSLYREPVTFGGLGVALRPLPEDPEGLLGLVEELGVGPVLLRLHPWDPDARDAEEELARELAARGHEVSFALPQTRDLVRDRERWRAAVAEIAERFTPYGRAFQVGQAVNRSKWGVWTAEEYATLLADAREPLTARRPDVEILGPAVIDFEFHATAGLLNRRRPGLAFDAVSALLYVDRRGAPENRQAGFDTVDKVVLLRALAETGRNAASPRCWITEVNWPLLEGPHSPAGRSVSVDEETQADYLVRYYLLALGTGLVERVFWWQMVARGYGLACPGDGAGLRRRPAFRALAALVRELEGATFLGPVPASPGEQARHGARRVVSSGREEAPDDAGRSGPSVRLAAPADGDAAGRGGAPPPGDARLYRFRRADGTELVVGWSAADRPAEATLPRPVASALGRDGTPEPPPDGTRVMLDRSPRYLVLGPE